MFVRYLHWIGIAACVTLIISCFLPWTFHADLNQTFNGFYSYDNHYGKPGKFLVFFGALMLLFMFLPKLWAKRTNLFISSLTAAYAVKTFILFSSCYNNYCPQKLFGIYLMLGCCMLILVAAVFPNARIAEKNNL